MLTKFVYYCTEKKGGGDRRLSLHLVIYLAMSFQSFGNFFLLGVCDVSIAV